MPHSVDPAAELGNTLPTETTTMEIEAETAMEVEPPAAAPGSPFSDEGFVMVETDGVQGVAANANPTAEAPSAQAAADADMGVEIQQAKKPEIKLEDLFEGMDSDDDDFLGSNNQLNAKEPAVEVDHDPSFELLRIYYQRFFPWRYMFQWLNHSPVPTNDFKHREFSLWLHNDAVMRYQSYATSDLFRKDVLRLMPRRIEIGPVYTADPIDRKSYRNSTAFLPMAKELCFDIDLTDYDDIRTCCDKANICNKCWKFTTMAIKVMDTALREDFGYRHILWVYSGRRGVHAWVCDKQARTLQDHQRKAMASYFEVVSGKAGGKRVNVRRPLHPHLSRSIDLLKEHFQRDVLEAQDPWASPEKADALLLQHLPDVELREALRKKWDASPGRTSSSKWADIDALAQAGAVGAAFDPKDLLDAKQDILLEHAYPRLDIAVSQKLNHLLKSPFVIHPGTGRVCVPIDRRDLDGFDPLNVPTLQGLVREVDAWRGGGGGAAAEGAASGGGEGAGGGAGGSSQEVKHVQDWEKTSLKPYIEYFRSFVTALMKDERAAGVKREREEDGDVEVKAESLDF